ncbi:MAG TPA: hypothetical protein PLE74_00210 [Candidatus Cloacimonadota bacterium]|nr:hypothetical protein [Candidatus Cloacimonadota bacterium]HPT70682.1 hypothetical protein [Candidatus Cloacimonadota bacterium]
MKKILTLTCCLILVSLVFFTGCDKRNPPITKATTPLSELVHIVNMTASTDTIYADNGITYSNISVLVKDSEDLAASQVTVYFRSNLGGIIRQVTTDSSGVAKTTFYSRGENETGDAKVEAIIKSATTGLTIDSTSTIVHIIPIPAVSNLTLELNATTMLVDQVVTLRSKAKNILGADVPDNTLLTFSATRGFFLNPDLSANGDSIVVKTSNGTATVQYNAGPLSGPATIHVRIGTKITGKDITILPGWPTNLVMSSYTVHNGVQTITDESTVNNPDSIFISASVSDIHNNACPNALVKFQTSLGTFLSTNNITYKNTNSQGIAAVRFTPGLSSGSATIDSYINHDSLTTHVLFTVTSDEIYSMQFENSGQIDLNVAHTGGHESAILKVKLFDINGNLIDHPTNVDFSLIGNVPAGANLNGQGVGPITTISSGGIAQISVNSGTVSGPLSIRATAQKIDGTTVSATKANIVIHSGAPSQVILSIGDFNTGTAQGGGLWRIVAEAVVKDAYGNPVDYGTSVFFSLPENQPNQSILANCSIIGNAYVGNENVDGDSTAGVAYTTIIYNGVYTYELVKVRATTTDLQGNLIIGEGDLSLPLNSPNMEAVIIPGHLDYFTSDGNSGVKYCIIRISLTDGQGNPIHHARLVLTATRGFFVYWAGTSLQWPNPGGPNDPDHPNDSSLWNTIITDWYDPSWTGLDGTGHVIHDNNSDGSTNGIAEGRIKFTAYEIPNGDPQTGTPGTVAVTITVRLLGTNVSAETTCILLKYPFAQPGL